jgi:hypothetical protein
MVNQYLKKVHANLAIEPILRQILIVNMVPWTVESAAFTVHHERQTRIENWGTLAETIFVENTPVESQPENSLEDLLELLARYDNKFINAFKNLWLGRCVRDLLV